MSTQIIAFAKETKSKKLLFQELPYHGVNIIFNNHDQVLKSLGSLYMYMRVLTVFEQYFSVSSREISNAKLYPLPASFSKH